MSDQFNQLHQYLTAAIDEIRRRANAVEASGFRLDIECSGRVADGEVLVTYKLSTDSRYYNSDAPHGARLGPVLEEAIRRFTWQQSNEPTALPAPSHARTADVEISF